MFVCVGGGCAFLEQLRELKVQALELPVNSFLTELLVNSF